MLKHPYLFLIGFAAGYLPALLVLKNISAPISEPTEVAVYIPTIEVALEKSDEQLPEPKNQVLAAAEEIVTTQTTTPSPSPTPTPEPTATFEPTPTPDVWSPPALEPFFAQYAGMYSVDKNILERLANCESHFDGYARNGDYLGMFQFSRSTWTTYRSRMGADVNPELRTNVEESIKTAAYVIQQQGVSPWPSCLR